MKHERSYTERLIIVYGLNDDQVKEVETNVPVKDCEVIKADCFTDIIALPQMASIIIWSVLTQEDKELLIEYYSEIAPFSETVIVIGDVDVPDHLRKHLSIYSTYQEFAPKMRYVFLNAYKKTKKNENFSATLANSLKILSTIRRKPFVSTRDLADELELSERTIQRYIETLRVAGEWIEYDVSQKGWTLLSEGKSMLFGDVFEED